MRQELKPQLNADGTQIHAEREARDLQSAIWAFRPLRFFRGILQAIAHASDRVDEPACFPQLFSDGGHVNVDGAIGDENIRAHRLIH